MPILSFRRTALPHLAKDNVITHIYPLTNNIQVLGLAYEQHGTQWPAVKRAIDTQGFFKSAGFNEIIDGIEFALRGKDALGEHGEVFIGNAALFNTQRQGDGYGRTIRRR